MTIAARFNAKVVARNLPKLGRYVQRVIGNPRHYITGRLMPYYADARKLCAAIEMSEEDWDVVALLLAIFYALGEERGRRG